MIWFSSKRHSSKNIYSKLTDDLSARSKYCKSNSSEYLNARYESDSWVKQIANSRSCQKLTLRRTRRVPIRTFATFGVAQSSNEPFGSSTFNKSMIIFTNFTTCCRNIYKTFLILLFAMRKLRVRVNKRNYIELEKISSLLRINKTSKTAFSIQLNLSDEAQVNFQFTISSACFGATGGTLASVAFQSWLQLNATWKMTGIEQSRFRAFHLWVNSIWLETFCRVVSWRYGSPKKTDKRSSYVCREILQDLGDRFQQVGII